jgi:hypothetical protein
MTLDDFQNSWRAQDDKIAQLIRLNSRLQLRAALAKTRCSMRGSGLGDVFEILCGVAFLGWTGHFIYANFMEVRFVIPAAALHLWAIGATATAAVRCYRATVIDYDAPIIEIQRQLESLRVFTLRSIQVLLVTGIPIWCVPFGIVALRAWLGIDLYSVVKANTLTLAFAVCVLLGLAVWKACEFCSSRLQGSPRLQRIARTLAGHAIAAAQVQLARLAAFKLVD